MQPKDAAEDIVIAGAGLAGLAAALGLHRYADALGCGLATFNSCQPIQLVLLRPPQTSPAPHP